MAQPEWLNAKRQPRPKQPRQPSNVSLSGVLWMTLLLAVLTLFIFA